MPMQVMGEPVKAMRCRGKVVRVGESVPGQPTRITAVQFDYFEVARDFSETVEPPYDDLMTRWSPT